MATKQGRSFRILHWSVCGSVSSCSPYQYFHGRIVSRDDITSFEHTEGNRKNGSGPGSGTQYSRGGSNGKEVGVCVMLMYRQSSLYLYIGEAAGATEAYGS